MTWTHHWQYNKTFHFPFYGSLSAALLRSSMDSSKPHLSSSLCKQPTTRKTRQLASVVQGTAHIMDLDQDHCFLSLKTNRRLEGFSPRRLAVSTGSWKKRLQINMHGPVKSARVEPPLKSPAIIPSTGQNLLTAQGWQFTAATTGRQPISARRGDRCVLHHHMSSCLP